ncbi:hypothetical protein L7F22_024564, partial [Adiantum nelumboides]|nr:hypothetical protein [Adiantum nelumboides]
MPVALSDFWAESASFCRAKRFSCSTSFLNVPECSGGGGAHHDQGNGRGSQSCERLRLAELFDAQQHFPILVCNAPSGLRVALSCVQ